MLKTKKLPELKVEGLSTAFKRKQPSVDRNQGGAMDENEVLLKTLIDRNIKLGKSAGKESRHKAGSKNERNKASPLKERKTEANTSLKNKPYLRLDKIEYGWTQNKTKQIDADQLWADNSEQRRRYNQRYPATRARSQSEIPARLKNGKPLRPRRRSLLSQMIRYPNQYQTFKDYIDSNGLNLSLVIREKMIHVNFLRAKQEASGGSLPLKVFS